MYVSTTGVPEEAHRGNAAASYQGVNYDALLLSCYCGLSRSIRRWVMFALAGVHGVCLS